MIKGQYHPNCYAYYAADSNRPAWGEVRWKASHAFSDYSRGELVDDDLNGCIKVKFGEQFCTLKICSPDLPGDGTVPEPSGQAPKPYVKQIFRHEGKAKGHPSYDHQASYSNDFTEGLTLYSIAKLTLASGMLNRIPDA